MMLARKALKLSSKSTRCLILLELQLVPIEFIIKSKRINFLHNLLSSESSSLARNVFLEQSKDPIEGDFASLVKKDLKEFNIELSFEEIMNFSKVKFKQLVRNSCEKACFLYLKDQRSKISKGKEISYELFQIQSYLIPGSNFSSDDICNILKCRIRDLDIKGNFPKAYSDTKCPFPHCSSSESQIHFAYCSFYSNGSIIPNNVQYIDIFKSDIKKQYQIMKILTKRIEERNKNFGTSLYTRGGPGDPRGKERPVRKGVTQGHQQTATQPRDLGTEKG